LIDGTQVKGPDIYIPPLTGKPNSSGEQFEVTSITAVGCAAHLVAAHCPYTNGLWTRSLQLLL